VTTRQRGAAARLGLTLLNLLAPGLGLLRIGDKRRALIIYGITICVLLSVIAAFAATSNISFVAYAVLVAVALMVTLVTYITSMWWTWSESEVDAQPRHIWARWYSIIGAMLLSFVISWLLTSISKNLYHNFYLPSEAMEPTLMKNDRLVASMRRPKHLHRGEVVLVNASPGVIYVKRLAALPGDKVALKDGLVFINGQAARLEPAGIKRVSYPYLEATEARLYRETLPGEVGSHLIQDLGASDEDNMKELTVAPGHVFVLGDNRDNSADSRISRTMGGLEQVALDDVIGRALFLYWPLDKMGRSLRTTDHR
jgi:signal peptidase I